ncbi:VanZ family protein [Sporosarcina thermotolerans]|uniref:VanZ family protein n=1 Tax=Sporosarcina thermotolerans TaxID=633404 RepID=A0AAW9AA74_9BACL|nr:VanZ family protein [Sporosarcina thermotolerans]MDW0116081.1 VanZ family protein [Sporosarcina thermotolerans]WHT48052.1 VanZ family protein [Sporosarcina thermotolerans]
MFTRTLTLIWIFFILVAGCTYSAHAFLYNQVIHFTPLFDPTFADLLITTDFNWTSRFFWIQKFGHMTAFGIMYILVLSSIQKEKKSLIICTVFALITEIMQLFFGRNGRFYDVGIDFIGIFVSFAVCHFLLRGYIITRQSEA